MSDVVKSAENLAIGSYRTVFYPGKTGLKFDKARRIYSRTDTFSGFTFQIDSATVSGNKLIVLWSAIFVSDILWWSIPNTEDAVNEVKKHFEDKNPGEAFSIEETTIFTAGVVPPRTPGEILEQNIGDPLKKLVPDLSGLTSKIGIALIVLAVGIAFFAGYKAFGKSA